MQLKGIVTNVIFYNQENGYTVLTLEANGEEITAVGNLPILSVGEAVELEGNFTVHSKFGTQFQIKKFTPSVPETKEGVIRYLGSGLIKGVGPATAKNIVTMFGMDSLKILETDPMRLTCLKGISERKALQISNDYAELKKMQNQIMFLQGYQLTTNLSIKIYNVYKENTQKLLTENPYRLIDDVDGVGFLTADRIAQNMGIEKDSIFRIRAGIVYTLKEAGEKTGNTFVFRQDLFEKTLRLLRIDVNACAQKFDDILSSLQLETAVTLFDKDGATCVALTRYYQTERSIAAKLIRIKTEALKVSPDVESLMQEYGRIHQITLHENQKEAIRSAVQNGACVITGGPGTGKTTIVRCISYIFDTLGFKAEYCSPTGRASKRLSESVGKEAKTIHRLLGMSPAGGKVNFLYNEFNPLNADAIVVDELSMVDINVMNSLLKAVRRGCRLVMVGDKDQLPSVGVGNVLADIIRSGLIPVTCLTYIYRQSADSLIVENAHKINEGKMPVVNNSSKDFFVTYRDSAEATAETVRQMVCERLPKFTGVKPYDIQVLAPLKAGVSGVENLNRILQENINPPSKRKPEVSVGGRILRFQDKVMQTVNDYELEWERYEKGMLVECGTGVFNGDIGCITNIDRTEGLVQVTFEDGRVANYMQGDLVNLILAYAVTIHKSQGSEFDVVVIPLVSGPPTILNKNLLYTAVTRAKKVVVLVGGKKCLAIMVKNHETAERNTMLAEFLSEEEEKYRILFGTP